MICCQFYVDESVTRYGAPRVSSRGRLHTGSEFSEKVVRTTLTNKTVSW